MSTSHNLLNDDVPNDPEGIAYESIFDFNSAVTFDNVLEQSAAVPTLQTQVTTITYHNQIPYHCLLYVLLAADHYHFLYY
jgi:hypothetical protein